MMDADRTIELTAYVAAVIFVATLIRSTLGFGEALFAVPLLALVIPVAIAAPDRFFPVVYSALLLIGAALVFEARR